MKIFAAALNLIAFTSAISLRASDTTQTPPETILTPPEIILTPPETPPPAAPKGPSAGEKKARKNAGQVYDDCFGTPKCIIDKLGGMGLPKDVGAALQKTLEGDVGKSDARKNFTDAIWETY